MKTFFFTKEELNDLKLHDYMLKRYLVQVVVPRLGLDLTKGTLRYDLNTAELYYDDKPEPKASEQPITQDKPGKDGNKPIA